MEFSEDSGDRMMVFKGKRSKRPRQLSLVAVTSTSSLGGGSDGGSGREIYSSSPIQYSSPASSATQISSSSTEEDEDMANCLILLAQSGYQPVEKNEKINSRKFRELDAGNTTGKAGLYVYECKTCNRTFPSFQALGGHRTSHKKAKTVVEETKKDHDQVEEKLNRINIPDVSTVNTGNYSSHSNKGKIHECSICGAEFSSGQALGGHMRRHRPPTTNNNAKVSTSTTVETSNNTTSESSHENIDKEEKQRIIFSLDLNLPAPPEDDSKFDFSANKQSLVFTAGLPLLVTTTTY